MTSIKPHTQSCNAPFLIVAGVSKAGTTSLYHFLANRPGTSPCRIKEPFFFLPPEIPFKIRPRYFTDPLPRYLELFDPPNQDAIRVEASSLYFSCPGVADRISRTLPNTEVIISLRDPIARLVSAFRMAVRKGWVSPDLGLDHYVAERLAMARDPATPLFERLPLDQGLYAPGLVEWTRAFGRSRVHVVWFNDIVKRQDLVARRLLALTGESSRFMAPIELPHLMRGARATSVRRNSSPNQDLVRRLAGRARALFCRTRSEQSHGMFALSRNIRKRLHDFYARDAEILGTILGQLPPWAETLSTEEPG